MTIQKILVKNYKLLKEIVINLNPEINIFVGDNDAGKSTILEVLSILTTGKLNGYSFDRQLKASFFNREIRDKYIEDLASGHTPEPPRIIMEAYFNGDAQFKGSDNELSEDTAGIRAVVDLNENNSETYRHMLADGEVKDIPIELYGVSFHYFSGAPVSFRYSPFNSVYIDTARKEYIGLVDRFVSSNITDNLTEDELTNIAIAYKASRRVFHDYEVIQKLNEVIKVNAVIDGRNVSIDLREDDVDAWKKQMSLVVDDIPFEHIGFGTQNIIKIDLALRNAEKQANVCAIEL